MASYDVLQNVTSSRSYSIWFDINFGISDKMPSLRSISAFILEVSSIAQTALGLSRPFQRLSGNSSASAVCNSPQLSCSNSTVVENLCCFNAPGGLLLQTQFWDYNPATGPEDSWTIHGLWVCIIKLLRSLAASRCADVCNVA